MQIFGHVEVGLVQRQRLDDRGVLGEDLAYLLGDRLVHLETRLHEDQVRALPLRGNRWHGRPDAELARFVAGRRHDAALPRAADGDRLAAKIRIVPLLDGCIEGVHVDVDDLPLTARGSCLIVIVLDGGHIASSAVSSLTPRATIRSVPSVSGRCSFRASSDEAVIQASTSSGVVRITGIAFGWMAPTSAFGSVVRNAKRSLVVSPSLTFPTDVQLVQMPAKQARGRVSSRANQMSPPSALLNSLKLLNGTTQRFSTPSQRVQCLLFALRMLVVPPSGSILSNSLKSTGLPLACSFSARFFVASINAFAYDGIPHPAVGSSRPSS